jgi:undecaprenyl-diphosphatase
MGWFEALILGVVQGLTEFLPVSSSAHILIVSQLFGWQDPGAAFTAVTQIGTELAVLLYFRKDLVRIISTWGRSLVNPSLRRNLDARMGWYIIIGTIPVVILGVVFADLIETGARNLWLVSFTLMVFYHAALGLQVIIEDYIHAKWLHLLTTLALKSALFLLALATLSSILQILTRA